MSSMLYLQTNLEPDYLFLRPLHFLMTHIAIS